MKRNRRDSQEFNISFLDIICCGFGAIVLLLMITKTVQPVVLEKTEASLEAQVADLQKKLFTIRGDTKVLNRSLNAKQEQLSLEDERVAILRGKLSALEDRYQLLSQNQSLDDATKGQLQIALQSLTAEMQRLLGENYKRKNDVIGGIPVDSEYIIFVIDTSGSMYQYAWERLQREMINILDIYPDVKGIQVMNDMGDYMYSNYRGQWIPDTEGRRAGIIKRLRSWNPFSNSSPVEGLQKAIRTFYDADKKISIYIMGDEFTGRSIPQVLDTVDRLNQHIGADERMVRIHVIGFPVQFFRPEHVQTTGKKFSVLMRELAYRNNGTFVGLNDYRL